MFAGLEAFRSINTARMNAITFAGQGLNQSALGRANTVTGSESPGDILQLSSADKAGAMQSSLLGTMHKILNSWLPAQKKLQDENIQRTFGTFGDSKGSSFNAIA
jgi:hypothetical protein